MGILDKVGKVLKIMMERWCTQWEDEKKQIDKHQENVSAIRSNKLI